jgi:hypothetical protein
VPVKIDWNGFGISPEIWTLIMILIATAINIIITWKRNMREFAMVGAWALIAIGVANNDGNLMIAYTAFTTAAILIINSSVQAFKNRHSNPVKKMTEKK